MRPVFPAFLLFGLVLAGAAAAADKSRNTIDEVLASSGKRFVPMDEITTPIFGESQIEGGLTVRLVLETSDDAAAGVLRTQIPKIRATAVTTTLEFARLNASGYAPVEAPVLSSALNRAIKAIDPRVTRVLIVRLGAQGG
ncbi:hypothetical protein ACLBWH_06360 [Sphingomonas sp. M6A6_1c]